LIEDDQEYSLDTISGTDNPAMINLSDETFVENRNEFASGFQYSEVTGDNERTAIDDSGLVLDVEPEEELVLRMRTAETFQMGMMAELLIRAPLSWNPGSELITDSDNEANSNVYSGKRELIIDDADNSQVISGSDVEERLEEFFGKDLLGDSSVKSLVPEDEEVEETLIQDFYTISGEKTANAGVYENLDGVDMVELDRQLVLIESLRISKYLKMRQLQHHRSMNKCILNW
jgi:hypothetical protein